MFLQASLSLPTCALRTLISFPRSLISPLFSPPFGCLPHRLTETRGKHPLCATRIILNVDYLCILHSSQVAHQAGAYSSFCSMKQLGVFLLPLDGMLVKRRVTSHH